MTIKIKKVQAIVLSFCMLIICMPGYSYGYTLLAPPGIGDALDWYPRISEKSEQGGYLDKEKVFKLIEAQQRILIEHLSIYDPGSEQAEFKAPAGFLIIEEDSRIKAELNEDGLLKIFIADIKDEKELLDVYWALIYREMTKSIAEYYGKYAGGESVVVWEHLRNITKKTFIEPMGIRWDERILDFGTGEMAFLAALAAEYSEYVFALDVESKVIETAEKAVSLYDVNDIEFINNSINIKIPIENDFLDRVMSSITFYQFPGPIRFRILREFYRVLKAGGEINIIAYNDEGFWTSEEWVHNLTAAGFREINVRNGVLHYISMGVKVDESNKFIISAIKPVGEGEVSCKERIGLPVSLVEIAQ